MWKKACRGPLCLAVIIGSVIGAVKAAQVVTLNNYSTHNLNRLIFYSFQENLNYWLLAACICAVCIIVILLGALYCFQLLYKKPITVYFTRYAALFDRTWVRMPAYILLAGVVSFNIVVIAVIDRTPHYPNIILISIDDLRADHLGCYGYTRNTSPYLDAFAKDNILFENCFVHEPWTLTSHMSMLTSLYPITQKVDLYTGRALSPAFVTLAEVLKNEGFQTLAFANAGIFMDAQAGFYQGFDSYIKLFNYSPSEPSRNAEFQTVFIKNYLQKNVKKNFFLFVHFFDVHSDHGQTPYSSPPPFNTLFTKLNSIDLGFTEESASIAMVHINKRQQALTKEQLDYLAALYDNSIAYMDQCIGDFFAMLKELDLYENSLIIITSDHGEEFQEHGYLLHSNPYYYDELIHVPLIIKLPHGSPIQSADKRRIAGLVESIDIMPSTLDLLDITTPARVQGKSFKNLLYGNGEGKEYVYGFNLKGSFFVRSKRWKLMSDQGLEEKRLKLFNIENDPLEQNNLAANNIPIKKTLTEKIAEKIAESEQLHSIIVQGHASKNSEGPISYDKEQIEQLKQLGYIQ